MEDLLKAITETYGVVGILILAPMIALVALWKENRRLNHVIVEGQELRVKDAQVLQAKILELATEQTKLNTETNIVLDRVEKALDTLVRR